jgi:hypothetical protein
MGILPSNNAGPRRATDGIVAANIVEPHALCRNPVQIRRLGIILQPAAIARDRFRSMVVPHDKKDIGFGWLGRSRPSERSE